MWNNSFSFCLNFAVQGTYENKLPKISQINMILQSVGVGGVYTVRPFQSPTFALMCAASASEVGMSTKSGVCVCVLYLEAVLVHVGGEVERGRHNTAPHKKNPFAELRREGSQTSLCVWYLSYGGTSLCMASLSLVTNHHMICL
jgi:hypothetical protein